MCDVLLSSYLLLRCAPLKSYFFPFLLFSINAGGNCRCYAFCSRKCQALAWKAEGHKKVCDSFKYIRENEILSVADIRESGGDPNKLDISKLQLSKPFQCCSDPNCKCEMKGGDPVALYRELNGERFFTGMVSTVGSSGQIDFSKVRKLHNAGDDINDGVSFFSFVNI